MDYKSYSLLKNPENTRFQFLSIGKRGIFEKVISFTPLTEGIQNLALLDYNPVTQEAIDMSVTDNGDLPEVLATAMKASNFFFEKHPDKLVYFKGSTDSCTRLYNISIGKVYRYVDDDLTIYGLKNGEWINFEPNREFESFLIAKKS